LISVPLRSPKQTFPLSWKRSTKRRNIHINISTELMLHIWI
jgi:hypothetical protein